MNKLLKELAKQADEHADKLGLGGAEWCDAQSAKFAELIVRECSKQAALFSINKNQIHPDITYDEMSDSAQTVCHMTSQEISERIKKHFGVKR